MGKYAVAFLFCLASSIANAEYKSFKLEKTVSCGPAAALMEFLERDYNEKQVWVGIDTGPTDSFIGLLVNSDNKHWTLVQYNSHTACILGSGIRGTPPPTGANK